MKALLFIVKVTSALTIVICLSALGYGTVKILPFSWQQFRREEWDISFLAFCGWLLLVYGTMTFSIMAIELWSYRPKSTRVKQ